jgi:hypothetical protein
MSIKLLGTNSFIMSQIERFWKDNCGCGKEYQEGKCGMAKCICPNCAEKILTELKTSFEASENNIRINLLENGNIVQKCIAQNHGSLVVNWFFIEKITLEQIGSINIDSDALKAACKTLKIKHTYKAITELLKTQS